MRRVEYRTPNSSRLDALFTTMPGFGDLYSDYEMFCASKWGPKRTRGEGLVAQDSFRKGVQKPWKTSIYVGGSNWDIERAIEKSQNVFGEKRESELRERWNRDKNGDAVEYTVIGIGDDLDVLIEIAESVRHGFVLWLREQNVPVSLSKYCTIHRD